MGGNEQDCKNDGILAGLNKKATNIERSDGLVKELKQSLDGFRQDLRFHPYVNKQGRRESSKWQRKLLRLPNFAWYPVLAITGIICITIGMSFIFWKSTPTWADVSERYGSISSYSGSYYIRDKGLFDSTKQYTFSDKTLNISIDYTTQLEFWVGYDNRIRLINGKKVTFAKKGGFFKTYDLHTRKESIPDITTAMFLRGNGYIDCFHDPSPHHQYNFGALFSGEIDETAVFVNTRKVISEDLVVFDVESIEGWKGQWRFRIWALRGSKLPIRILARSSYGSRTDIVFNYVNKQPKEFFDPEIFEAKLKDPQISLPDLMYMGLKENASS